MASAAAMREVVERLRAEGSPAFGELLELHTAVDEMVRGFEQLAEAAGRVSETAEFMLESLRELRRGVQNWNIASTPAAGDGGGNTPNAGDGGGSTLTPEGS